MVVWFPNVRCGPLNGCTRRPESLQPHRTSPHHWGISRPCAGGRKALLPQRIPTQCTAFCHPRCEKKAMQRQGKPRRVHLEGLEHVDDERMANRAEDRSFCEDMLNLLHPQDFGFLQTLWQRNREDGVWIYWAPWWHSSSRMTCAGRGELFRRFRFLASLSVWDPRVANWMCQAELLDQAV